MELTFGSRDLNDQTSINPNEIAKGMVLEERTGDDDEGALGDNGALLAIKALCVIRENKVSSRPPTRVDKQGGRARRMECAVF